MEFRCTKCGSLNMEVEQKGSQVGLYCADCGKWIKWLSKDEQRAFNNQNCPNDKYNKLKNKIIELIGNINAEVDREFSKEPISQDDALRKSAYTCGLDKVRYSLEDIIEMSDSNED